jgi:hypothetical protein
MIEKEVMRHGSASGIGDTYFDASYRVVEETDTLPETSLHAGVTIPTADEDKGLGTGEIDYRAGFIVSKDIGMATVEGGLDYNIMGEPDDYDLDNYVSGFAGVTTSITDKLDMYMELSGAQAASEESDTELAAAVQLSYDLQQYGAVIVGASKGLSDGSPDFAILVGYSFSF